jgi:hypothetical protein
VVGLLLLALAEPDEARGRERADLSGMAFVASRPRVNRKNDAALSPRKIFGETARRTPVRPAQH